jgi:hypothetical protein
MAPIQRCRPSEFDTQSDRGWDLVLSRRPRLALRFEASLNVLWRLALSSNKGYLSWVQILELRVLSEPHERRHVLFDQKIGQLSSDDFGAPFRHRGEPCANP